MSVQKDWNAKLESAYSFMLRYSKIKVCREHFIFWQQYKESEEVKRYLTFYQTKKAKNGQKTVSEWPYVAILDPRTGELIVTWQKLDAATFCDLVTEFLSLHPSLEPLDATDFKNNGFSMAKRRKSTDANCILGIYLN